MVFALAHAVYTVSLRDADLRLHGACCLSAFSVWPSKICYASRRPCISRANAAAFGLDLQILGLDGYICQQTALPPGGKDMRNVTHLCSLFLVSCSLAASWLVTRTLSWRKEVETIFIHMDVEPSASVAGKSQIP